jgi:subtilase family serine protease
MNMKLLRVGILALSAAAFAACDGAVDSLVGPTQALQTLHNHVRPAVSSGKAAQVGHLPATQGLNVSIVLPARNQAALTTFLEQVYDPSSPKFHQFLSVDEFTDQFGPTADDYQAVVDFAKANGLTVTDKPMNRAIVPLRGTVEQVEKALHVKMNLYQHPTESRTFFSPDREPSLDLKVAVNHISGLNNYSTPRPALALPSAGRATPAVVGSGPGGTSYLASDMRAAYYSTTAGETGLTGSGQTVGLVEFDGYNISDVVLSSDGRATSTAHGGNFVLAYTPTAGGTTFSIPINNVLLDGATGAPCQLIPSACQDAEQALDILQPIGMAPGLSQVRVYIGSSDVDILNAMATENIAKEVSISWLWSPDDPSTDDFIFQELAAQGQSVFAASGDDGAYNPIGVFPVGHFFPAEDAWVTSVGGTDLTTSGTAGGGPWSSETAWVDSGGGISLDGIPMPSYQAGVADTANGGSTTVRNVPDVAAEANFDNYVCSLGVCQGTFGGTSFAAPRWAGFLALVNQQAVAAHRPTLGFVNPLVYAIGQGSSFGADFHDITSGNNDNSGGEDPFFNAVAGYDLVTGWGSPMGQSLINTLAPPASAGFELSASPASVTVNPSGTATTTVTVSDVGGFTGSVKLSVSGLPNGVTASFGTNPTTASSVLTLTASSSVIRGSYLLALTGVSGTLSASTSLALEVNAPGFSIAASQGDTVLFPGYSTTNTITVTNFAGFTGNVSLALTSALPAGVTSSWSTNPTTGSSQLTLTASDTAPVSPQDTLVTVLGVSGTLVETATFDLTMDSPAFVVAVSPIPVDIAEGSSVTTTLSVVPEGAFTGDVNLSAPSLPTGVTATFASNPTTTGSQVTLTASSTAPVGLSEVGLQGDFVATIAGTTGSASALFFPVDVTATPTPSFTLGFSPVAMTVTQGGTVSTTVTVNKLNGFTGSVALALVGALPSGVTASLNSTTGVLTLTASSSAQVGLTNGLEVIGTSGSLSATGVYVLTVTPTPLFTLSASSASVTVAEGSSVQDTITLTPQTGFTGNATLTAAGLPNGVTALFGTNPVTSSSVLTLTAGSSALAGKYPVIVAGTSGGKAVTIPITLTVTSASDGGSSDASSDAASDASGSAGCANGSTIIAETGCASFPNFNTTSAVCVKVKVNTVNGWEASNVQGRTATVRGATTEGPITPVNGSMSNEPGLSAGADGFVYFNFTAGSVPYSSMACW